MQSSDDWRVFCFGREKTLVNGCPTWRPRAEHDPLIFEMLRNTVEARMKSGQLTIVDATLLTDKHRCEFAAIAERHRRQCLVIIFDVPLDDVLRRNELRDQRVPEEVIRSMNDRFERTSSLPFEIVDGTFELEVNWLRVPESEAISVIGDIHGCLEPLEEMLKLVGNEAILFLGDVIDRGPQSFECLLRVKELVQSGRAHCLMGNHEFNLLRGLEGEEIHFSSTRVTMDRVIRGGKEKEIIKFLKSLPPAAIGVDGTLYCHADQTSFDPNNCEVQRLIQGTSKLGETRDVDGEYDCLGTAPLVRGHILATGNSKLVTSLDRGCGFGGPLVGLLRGQITEVPSAFDYRRREQTFADRLKSVDKRLIRREQKGPLEIVKYTRKSYFDWKVWKKNPILFETRGIVLDLAGNPVNHPFRRLPHWHETRIKLSESVIAVRKVNGFLGQAFIDPYSGAPVFTSSGSFNGPFAELFRKNLHERRLVGPITQFLKREGGTLLFEVCDATDDHPIAEPDGVFLIGFGRSEGRATEAELDTISTELGTLRPEWAAMSAGEAQQLSRTVEHEGFILRRADGEELICKLKSTYYLTIKLLSRLNEKNTNFMLKNASRFVDETFIDELELKPLVLKLVAEIGEEWKSWTEQQKLDWCRANV